MANRTQKDAKSIKGTNPQYLVEKIIRTRIYDSKYWKEQCFGLSSELLVDKAMELDSLGGVCGANVQPCNFICLVLKMLQIQPSKDIIIEFIKNPDYKYVRVLGAMYLRLVGTSMEVYNYLEPLFNDYRKLKVVNRNGELQLSHVDEFVDQLLHEDRSCDIILPRIQKRHVLEQSEQLEPRVSALDEDLEADEDDEEEEEEEEEEENSPPPRRRSPSPYRDRERDRDKHVRHRSHSKSPHRRSRSRSPLHRRRSHSRSPRRHRHRSPSPRRHGRKYSRSPSPYHRDRGGRSDRMRDRGRERDHDQERDRDREREREREERDREKERERDRGRDKDREREKGGEKKAKAEVKDGKEKKKKKKKKDKESKKENQEDAEIREQNELRAKLGLKPLRV